jgi:hypothetical protein
MKTYWFSYSYRGENTGVFLTQAETDEEAIKLAEAIAPENDDVFACEIVDLKLEHPSLELDRLYTSQEMNELGYKTETSYK